ncbi:hypothetical protein [Falsiroseomonas sp. HW251]|uniref:hypothetical protein n=1 Tax=Falsiroseomonas sp. HW251 TaxID=3390998 RepID=UPI003D31517F
MRAITRTAPRWKPVGPSPFDAAIEEAEADFRAGRYTTIRSDADLDTFMKSLDTPE